MTHVKYYCSMSRRVKKNPKSIRNDVTPEFWNKVVTRCSPIVVTAEPSDASSFTPVESNPTILGGDSAQLQGVPSPSSGTTASGQEVNLSKESTSRTK